MNFVEFRDNIARNFEKMLKENGNGHLFLVAVDRDEMWNVYLDSFPPEKNKIFRKRREFDCSCCRNFIKNIGNVVSIKNGVVHTIWDFDPKDDTYQFVVEKMREFLGGKSIENEAFFRFGKYGNLETYENTESGILTWNHFNVNIPNKFIVSSIGERQGASKANKDVLMRSMETFSIEAIETVIDLISQNLLYRGNEWDLSSILNLKKKYDKIKNPKEKDIFCWEMSTQHGPAVSRIKNHSIGVLITDLSQGVDIETAVKRYENIVAPQNYKRPKSIFTKKMLDEARKEIERLGYSDSLERRFANVDDVNISQDGILFVDRKIYKPSSGVFEQLEQAAVVKNVHAQKIPVSNFISDVIPTAQNIELLLSNKNTKNLVSLIVQKNMSAPSLFKWDNPFGWSYTGNIADSEIRENVKKAGGNIHGILRFSIQWNDGRVYNGNDFDAHCVCPYGHIAFYDKRKGSGELDVDIVNPRRETPAVENIVFTKDLKNGTYKFFVDVFTYRGGDDGFRAEIEMNGEVFSYNFDGKDTRHKGEIPVATVKYENGTFSIVHELNSESVSNEIWNIKTMTFIPVSCIMYSPNYWNGNEIGNKHIFFMLKGCVNPDSPNGIYNEFLKNEFNKHKRVFEALGSILKAESCQNQLSGVGFSFTQRNNVIVKVTSNNSSKMYEIVF